MWTSIEHKRRVLSTVWPNALLLGEGKVWICWTPWSWRLSGLFMWRTVARTPTVCSWRTVPSDARGVRAYARNLERHRPHLSRKRRWQQSAVSLNAKHSGHVYCYVASKDSSIQVNGDIRNLQVGRPEGHIYKHVIASGNSRQINGDIQDPRIFLKFMKI